jgi:hypothetical protein
MKKPFIFYMFHTKNLSLFIREVVVESWYGEVSLNKTYKEFRPWIKLLVGGPVIVTILWYMMVFMLVVMPK